MERLTVASLREDKGVGRVFDDVAAALKASVVAEKLLGGIVACWSGAGGAVCRSVLALRESGGHSGEHGGDDGGGLHGRG